MKLHFLSGLPRSGSTVLAAILNQHPQIHVSTTSGLSDVMGAVCAAWENNPAMSGNKAEVYRLLRTLPRAKYQGIRKPIVLDKSRSWPAPLIMSTMAQVFGKPPRIVATVRSIPDCAASFVRIAKPNNIKDFLRQSHLIQYLKSSYATLQQGYAAAPENFCIVDYVTLLANPLEQLERIHKFLSLDEYSYDLEAIEGSSVAERDEEAWGIKGLHDIKPRLEPQHNESSRIILGDLYTTFLQPEFWNGDVEPVPQVIDLQKEANIRGNFTKGWELAQVLEAASPGDDRAAFNRGWHLCHQGKLAEGVRLLDRGRAEDVFGNPNPGTGMPIWDGSPGTVLLNLECGFGDQIHGARYVQSITARGCKVVLAGSPEVMPLLKDMPGVSAVCSKSAGPQVYHDFWMPSMSVPSILGLDWLDIDGRPYLPVVPKRVGSRLRIGLRWRGNAKIEDDTHRVFPHELLFDAVQRNDIDFVSLQRDDGTEHCPSWVERVPLDSWMQTAQAIASCDLVISSCTSVAHLAAAMGVQTWIIVPVMPYYLWALPGNLTPWYNCVRLFRQEVYGDWTAPFIDMADAMTRKGEQKWLSSRSVN